LSGSRRAAGLLLAGTLLLGTATAGAASIDDRILPLEQYSSDKGRRLAAAYLPALRELNTTLYHCLPWVEVQKQSIGFFKPRHLGGGDDRYLSVRLYVEQDPSPQFAGLSVTERASSMFSRYVGALLRRMVRAPGMLTDPLLDGFTVVLEWLKQAPRAAGGRPVHETIAVFVDRPTAAAYLTGGLSPAELAGRARVLGFDGETALGALRVAAWDDDFVSTYKVKNYQLAPGVSCP
jgi:hypothetical protein